MHTYRVHTMYMLSWKISLSRLFGLSRKRASRKPYYRCGNCTKETQTFFKETAVCFKWRCSMILIVRMIFYFMFGFAPGKVYRMMGGNAPGDRGCPLSYDTVCRYLFQMRKRVAIVGIQKLRNIKLAGPCQADETFVRTRAKFNRGRFRVNRKFTLVTSKVNFFGGGKGQVYVFEISSKLMCLRSWEFTMSRLNNSWHYAYLIVSWPRCVLSSSIGASREYRWPRMRGQGTTSYARTVGVIWRLCIRGDVVDYSNNFLSNLRNFVCPLTGAHTNNVERSWRPLKE